MKLIEAPDPDTLVPVVEEIMGTLGSLLEQTMQTANMDGKFSQKRAGSMCEGLKAVDIENAEESFMEYDAVLEEDRERS